jgi:hypothetical protein
MFCRHRCRSSAAAALLCLAALSILAVCISQPTYAKTNVKPVCATGDPDEFESRLGGGSSSGGRIAMSAEPSGDCGQYVSVGLEPSAGGRGDVRSQGRRETIWILVRRVVRFLAVELDV